MKIDFKPAIELINNSKKIGLITHKGGDGDAFGSQLALRDSLKQIGKDVVVFSNEKIPKHLGYINKSTNYNTKEKFEKIDLLVATDANTKKRLTVENIFNQSKKNKIPTILIDHHEPNGEGDEFDVVISSTKVSSASELVYELLIILKVNITKEIADYLFIGIETDTNFLNNPNTYNSTLKVRKDLIKKGANVEEVHKKLEEDSLLGNKEFLEEVNRRVVENDGVQTTYILKSDAKKYNFEPPVSSPIASYLDQKNNAKITLVAEHREGFVKVSMRSNKSGLDVSELASFLGGGGHKQAAGFEYKGKLTDLLSK